MSLSSSFNRAASIDDLHTRNRGFSDPQKYNPGMAQVSPKRSLDIFEKYQSQMDANPWNSASFRDTQAAKESYFPKLDRSTQVDDDTVPCQIYLVRSDQDMIKARQAFRYGSRVDESGSPAEIHHPPQSTAARPYFEHRQRGVSEPLTQGETDGVNSAGYPLRRTVPVAASENNFFGSKYSGNKLPQSLQLETINENEDAAQSRKADAKFDGLSQTKATRSPLKKLFGDISSLGRRTNVKDTPDSNHKKAWAGKMKKRVGELGKDFSEKLSTVTLQSLKRLDDAKGPSTFPISLSPYMQGDLYMELELLLQSETNRFITHELEHDRISLPSLKKVIEIWRNKGRPQVLGFRYDLMTQRDLIVLNVDSVSFSGVNSCSKTRLISVLAAWRTLAKEMSIRTYCQPDSAVKKHLADAARVLELIDAEGETMLAFQDLRKRILGEIESQTKLRKERLDRVHGKEVAWSPRRYEHKTH